MSNSNQEQLLSLLQAVANGKISPDKAQQMIIGYSDSPENLSPDQLDKISGGTGPEYKNTGKDVWGNPV